MKHRLAIGIGQCRIRPKPKKPFHRVPKPKPRSAVERCLSVDVRGIDVSPRLDQSFHYRPMGVFRGMVQRGPTVEIP